MVQRGPASLQIVSHGAGVREASFESPSQFVQDQLFRLLENLTWALIPGKIRVRDSRRLPARFGRCFSSKALTEACKEIQESAKSPSVCERFHKSSSS